VLARAAALGLGRGGVRGTVIGLVVVLDDDHSKGFGGRDAQRLALLLRPVADPRFQLLGVAQLARVGAERGELAVQGGGDVHPGGRVVRPEEVQPADGVGLQAVTGEPREGHRVAGRRIDGVDGCDPRGAVVGVVDAAVAVEQRLGIHRQHGIGAEGPDLADQLLTQGKVVGERAVRLVQEGDSLVADDVGGGTLLGLAQRRELQRIGAPVVSARVAARAAHEPAGGAGVDPGRRRGRRPEVRVVGMGHDHHEPLGSPRVGRPGRGVGHVLPPEVGRWASFRSRVRNVADSANRFTNAVLDFRARLRSSPPTSEAFFHARRQG
jgi:hypothetical protein